MKSGCLRVLVDIVDGRSARRSTHSHALPAGWVEEDVVASLRLIIDAYRVSEISILREPHPMDFVVPPVAMSPNPLA